MYRRVIDRHMPICNVPLLPLSVSYFSAGFCAGAVCLRPPADGAAALAASRRPGDSDRLLVRR